MVARKDFKYPDTKMFKYVKHGLNKRGVRMKDIAKIVYKLEKAYLPKLTVKQCKKEVINTLHKREVMNNIAIGLYLDKVATKGKIDEPLQSIIAADAGVFGVDESLAVAICNTAGSIALSNYGYLDKAKTGIIKRLDNSHKHVNTFIDDAVGAVAAAVAAKIAHGDA